MLLDANYVSFGESHQRAIEDIFEIKELLGSGSFSSVYRALDKTQNKKECAIKILN